MGLGPVLMSYGDNAREIRESMVWLLGHHRILQMLGGPGQPTVKAWTTGAEREQMGHIIQQYRGAALTWCLQAVTAVTPKTDLEHTSVHTRDTVEEFRYRLGAAVGAIGLGERMSTMLATRHDNELLVVWQRVSRAAVLGEHDFAAGVNLGNLPLGEAGTVLKDAASTARALVILDKRYKGVPGWVHLKNSAGLDRVAEHSSFIVDHQPRDLDVDERGWSPAPGVIGGPALPGIAGAVQAQHNMLINLGHFPNALNLRRLLHSQAEVSQEAAKHASITAPELVERLNSRATLYATAPGSTSRWVSRIARY